MSGAKKRLLAARQADVEAILLAADTAEPGPDGPFTMSLGAPFAMSLGAGVGQFGWTVWDADGDRVASNLTESQARTVRNALNRDARRGKEGDK